MVEATTSRLIALSGGVLVAHTLVTILEEYLFASPVFRAAGSSFMTLVSFLSKECFKFACRPQRRPVPG